jgi:hypothetical protein
MGNVRPTESPKISTSPSSFSPFSETGEKEWKDRKEERTKDKLADSSNPQPTDPLPNRPHAHPLSAESPPLLRSAAEAQRHRGICIGHLADPPQVAADRLRRRNVWHCGAVWGFLWHHRRLCERCAWYWTLSGCGSGRDGRGGQEGSRAARLSRRTRRWRIQA